EQRPNRTVNQPAGQDLLLSRPAFAFDEAAGEPPRGVGVLTVIDRKGEKAGAWLRFFGGAGGDQNNGIATSNDNGAVRLFGDLPGFQGNYSTTQVEFNGMHHLIDSHRGASHGDSSSFATSSTAQKPAMRSVHVSPVRHNADNRPGPSKETGV